MKNKTRCFHKRTTTAILMTAGFVIALLMCGLNTAWADTLTDVNSWSGLYDALQSGGSFRLTSDINYNQGDGANKDKSLVTGGGKTITLDLNGHYIRYSGDTGRVIKVSDGCTLTINDSTPDTVHFVTLENWRGTGVSTFGTEKKVSDTGTGVIKVKGGLITGGKIEDTGDTDKYCGGGIYFGNKCTFNMNGGNIVGNTAPTGQGKGGGVYFQSDNSNLSYLNLTGKAHIDHNQAHMGGGVYITGKLSYFNMKDTAAITDNVANDPDTDSCGGGIYLYDTIVQEMSGSNIIAGNRAQSGGGIYGYGIYVYDMLNSSISGNMAQNGGGVYLMGDSYHYCQLIMDGQSVIRDNEASLNGGGIYIHDDNYFGMDSSTEIKGNKAGKNGGGVYLAGEISEFEMMGGTISGNIITGTDPDSKGAGVCIDGKEEFAMTGSSLITSNEGAAYGGGVYTKGKFSMKDNAAVISNKGGLHGGIFTLGGLTMDGSSRVEDNESTGNDIDNKGSGGIYIKSGNSTIKGNAVISGNKGHDAGGVMLDSGKLSIEDSAEISENESDYGGGMSLDNDAEIRFNSGSVKNNIARKDGGGLYIRRNCSLFMSGGSIEGNTAARGGGVYDLFGLINLIDGGIITGNTQNDKKTPDNLCLFADKDTKEEISGTPIAEYIVDPVITVTGSLTGKIGVNTVPVSANRLIAVGDENGDYPLTEDDFRCFSYDKNGKAPECGLKYGNGDTGYGEVRTGYLLPDSLEPLVYNGGSDTAVTMKDGEKTLKMDKDFTVVFKKNGKTVTPKDVGTYTAFLTGIGDYMGEKEAELNVIPKEVALEWGDTSLIYNGSKQVPSVSVRGIITGDDCGLSVKGGETEVNADGETYLATAKITNSNYKLPENNTTAFTIGKAEIPLSYITMPSPEEGLRYTGLPMALVSPGSVSGDNAIMYYAVTEKDDAAPLFDGISEGVDKMWNTDVPKAKNAGIWFVWYRASLDKNHEDRVGDPVAVTIAEKDVTVKADNKTKKRGEKDPEFTVSLDGLIKGEDESLIEYDISRTKGEEIGKYDIILSGKKIQGNYEVSFENGVFTIEETDEPDNPDKPAENVISVSDNLPMAYSLYSRGEFSIGYCHEIPFFGKAKPGLNNFGEIKVLANGVTYMASKIKVNKKKCLIQITGLAGADRKTVKQVKAATKGANGLSFIINPYYVRNTDSVEVKRKKDGTIRYIKIRISGKYYKAKPAEFDFSQSTNTITFNGVNLDGSYRI